MSKFLLLAIFIITSNVTFAQNITLSNLSSLSKKPLSEVKDFLKKKGFVLTKSKIPKIYEIGIAEFEYNSKDNIQKTRISYTYHYQQDSTGIIEYEFNSHSIYSIFLKELSNLDYIFKERHSVNLYRDERYFLYKNDAIIVQESDRIDEWNRTLYSFIFCTKDYYENFSKNTTTPYFSK